MIRLALLLPLTVALVISGFGLALASTPTGATDWPTLLVSQGLAVVLVLWWVIKGYPDWRRDQLAQQQAQHEQHREDWKKANNQQREWQAEQTEILRDIRETQLKIEAFALAGQAGKGD